eukprot:jgi/Mesvir1/26734/Mv20510-RA.1
MSRQDGYIVRRDAGFDPFNQLDGGGSPIPVGYSLSSKITSLLKKAWKPVIAAKIVIVLIAIVALSYKKPKDFTFLDVISVLVYGKPSNITKPNSNEVLVQREATKIMRIIGASTLLTVAIIG